MIKSGKHNENKKALIIINPMAGVMKSKKSLFDIVNQFCKYGYILTTFITQKPGDSIKFTEENVEGHDICVCCGGDGTLNEVMNGLVKVNADIPLGFIPTGTTNDMSKTLGLPGKIKKAVKVVTEGEPVSHDIGVIDDEKYFTYVCSFGGFAQVSYQTPQKRKNRAGHFAYILEVMTRLGSIKPIHARIKGDDFEVEDDFLMGGVTNAYTVGGVLKFNKHDVKLDDGLFEVMLIKNPTTVDAFSKIVDALINKKTDCEYVLFYKASEIEMEFESETAFTIDGEYAGEYKNIKIKNLHNKIKLIRPKKTEFIHERVKNDKIK